MVSGGCRKRLIWKCPRSSHGGCRDTALASRRSRDNPSLLEEAARHHSGMLISLSLLRAIAASLRICRWRAPPRND